MKVLPRTYKLPSFAQFFFKLFVYVLGKEKTQIFYSALIF